MQDAVKSLPRPSLWLQSERAKDSVQTKLAEDALERLRLKRKQRAWPARTHASGATFEYEERDYPTTGSMSVV
jgi:hypothetical protein